MDKNEIALIAALKEKGLDDVADNILLILDERENRVNELEKQIKENHKRYESAALALNHFTQLELKHFTEVKSMYDDLINLHNEHVSEAFPMADPISHRQYHEKLIKSAEAHTEMYNAIRNEVIKKGFLWALIILTGLLWVGFEAKVKSWIGL